MSKDYDSEDEEFYEDEIISSDDSSEEEEENDNSEDEEEDDSEVEEEFVDEEEEVVEEQPEEVVEENDDECCNDEVFLEDEKVNTQTRKKEFNFNRKKIDNQYSLFKFNLEDVDEIVKREVSKITQSEKNVGIIKNNILSKGDNKRKIVNILRYMNYKDIPLKELLQNIKQDTTGYDNSAWDENREEIKKEVIRLNTKIEVIDSFIECPKCKQKKIQFYNVQLRRADEPPTTFNNCMNKMCLYSWRTG
jgi:DNA-directed RNA polymerase subunit M/transcription elongation factor TFIIS